MAIASVERLTVVQPSVVLADPHVLSDIRDRRSIIDSLYDALVRRAPDGSFAPWLALSWQTDEACQCWRFSLRPDVRFHDGSQMGVGDVLASIRRALSPELPGELGTQGVLRSYLKDARIYALAPQTLAVDCPESMADLLDLLVDIAIVPEHAIAGLPNEPIGSGPYRLTHAEAGHVEMQVFHEHWAGLAPANRLVWRAEPDTLRRQSLLEAGMADLVVDPERTLFEEASPNLQSQDGFLCIIFLFNLFDGPCRDPRVRQALNSAIDRAAIIADPDIAASAAVPLTGPLAPRHQGADSSVAPYPYNPERARALLQEAGYSEGLVLDIDLPERFPDESIALASKLSQYFAAVGVDTRLHVYPDRPGYSEKVRSKRFGDLCCFDSSPPSAWRVFREKLDSRHQGPWWQGYHSPALNQILDQASAQRNIAQRDKLLRHAFRIVRDDAPWLFLYAPKTLWLLGPLASGWQPSAEGRVRITHSQKDA